MSRSHEGQLKKDGRGAWPRPCPVEGFRSPAAGFFVYGCAPPSHRPVAGGRVAGDAFRGLQQVVVCAAMKRGGRLAALDRLLAE